MGTPATQAPPGFTVTARTEATPVAAMENTRGGLFGVQFHPEVMHTEHGTRILGRFLELGRLPAVLDYAQHRRGAPQRDPRAGR